MEPNPILTRPPGDLAVTRTLRRRCTKRDMRLRLAESGYADLLDHLAIATLSYNVTNAKSLFDMIDRGDVATVDFLASSYFQAANPREYEMLRAGLAERGQRLGIARVHAKVLASRLTTGQCVTVETSANLRSCRNVEQLCMTGGEDIFTFHATWIREMIGGNA
jgi:hypothetical protein